MLVNEAHHGPLQCVRTRRVGLAIVEAAHAVDVRNMAFEALPHGLTVRRNEDLTVSTTYLRQPEMRALVGAALERGWTLHGYDEAPPGELPCLAATNAREEAQARNLVALACDRQPLLVWCGNGHLLDLELDGWRPMGSRLRHDHNVPTFSIDQTCTVRWPNSGWDYDPLPHADVLRTEGSRGFLASRSPADFQCRGADAYILSLDNDMT